MKKLLPILAALLVGVGLGYLVFGGRPKESGGRDSSRSSKNGFTGQGAERKGVVAPAGPSGALAHKPRRASGLIRAVRERNVKLARENKRLTTRLSELEQDLLFARGKPTVWPPQIPRRLQRKAVLKAVNQALRQAGLDGEVTDVDCKEYPCVLSGNLKGKISAARFQKVLGTRALRSYDDDHAQTSITNRSGTDSLGRPWQRSHFAIAIMLGGPAGTQPDVKRTVYRLRQLLDAATAQ